MIEFIEEFLLNFLAAYSFRCIKEFATHCWERSD